MRSSEEVGGTGAALGSGFRWGEKAARGYSVQDPLGPWEGLGVVVLMWGMVLSTNVPSLTDVLKQTFSALSAQ